MGLLISAILLLSLPWAPPPSATPSNTHTLIIGCILGLTQGLALLPGISRFASTYVIARWLSLSPRRAMQTSFLMHLPLMGAAFLFDGIPLLLNTPFWHHCTFLSHPCPFPLLVIGIATIIATILAYGALFLSWRLALRNRLWVFGLYLLFILFVFARTIA